MAYIIKKLEEEIKEKDRRYHELLIEKQKRKERESQVVQLDKKGDKNYLQELLYKSREMSETNNKAFTDGMNMIFAKMSELQKRND